MGDLFPASEVLYWIPTDNTRNFGDYISELFLQRVLIAPRIRASRYRLIGSIIDNENIGNDLSSITDGGNIVYWGCGAREATPIHEAFLPRCEFYGVRGPLTRDLLGLPPDTVLGDPALLLPLLRPATSGRKRHGKVVCIPHIHEPRSDAELVAISGADLVIRPTVAATLEALEKIADQISGADFVMAGAMHAAILAHAYGVPFAFFDTGHLDIPFKWRDFAASIDVPAVFVRDLRDGRTAYEDLIRPKAKRLPLLPILAAAPYYVRPSIVAKAVAHDAGLGVDARLIAALEAAAIEGAAYAQAAVKSDKARNDRLQAHFDGQAAALAQATADLQTAQSAAAALAGASEALAAREAAFVELEALHRKAESDCGRLMAEAEHVRVELLRAGAAVTGLQQELELSRNAGAELQSRLTGAEGRVETLRALADRLQRERAEIADRMEADRADMLARQGADRAEAASRLAAAEDARNGLAQALETAEARERELRFENRLRGHAVPRANERWIAPWWDPRMLMARLAARRRRWAQAEHWYGKLLIANPNQTRILVQYGHALKELGQLELAASAYGRALILPGADVDLVEHLAFTLRATGRHAEAEAVEQDGGFSADSAPEPKRGGAFQTWLGVASPRSLLTRLAAIRAAKAGDWRRAARRYQTLVRAAPGHAPYWVLYGHALKEAGSQRDALAAYLTAARVEPRRADTHLQLGHALKMLRREADAKRAYSQAFQLAPSEPNIRRELEMRGMSGVELIRLLVEADTRPAGTKGPAVSGLVDFVKAKLAAKRKDWSAAGLSYRNYLKRHGGDWRSWVQYGHALKEQGRLTEAEGAYMQALAINPNDADLSLQLGHVLKLANRFEAAAEAYRRAQRLDPDLKSISMELAIVEGEISRVTPVVARSGGWSHDTREAGNGAALRQRLGLSRRQEKVFRELSAAVGFEADA